MESIIVAIITGGMALLGNVVSNLSTHSKTMYRICHLFLHLQLENQQKELYYIMRLVEVQFIKFTSHILIMDGVELDIISTLLETGKYGKEGH